MSRVQEAATLFASAARTATANGADQANRGHRGVRVTIDVTAAADTPSVVFTIQAKDPLSGVYTTILASAAITGTGTTELSVYPGGPVTANVAASAVLPAIWRVIATAADADSLTYSVGAVLLP